MQESLNTLTDQEIRQLNDSLVVESVLRGDLQAFEIFVRKYEISLTLLARQKLHDEELAEEAVQETFISALRSLDSYNSQFAFRTWLWTILINHCRKIGAKQKRAKRELNGSACVESELTSRETDPGLQAVQRESANQLSRFLDELPDVQAEAIRLRFFEGLKYQEIADTMRSSLSSAKQRVANGLNAISQKITNSSATTKTDVSTTLKKSLNQDMNG